MSVKMRQKVEREIATQVITDLLAAGYSLGVNDGEECTIKHSTDKAAILKAMFTTDEDWLLVYEPEDMTKAQMEDESTNYGASWWVRFIYGNDGWDVVSDYCVALEEHMVNANKLADEYGG